MSHESRMLIGLATVVAALAFAAPEALAQAQDPKEIVQKYRYRDDGDNGTSDVTMTLIDAGGKQSVRKLRVMEKDRGKDKLQVMFFLDPPDLKNTGFLTVDYDDAGKEDDQWLYLPALRKSKRIASTDKSSSFLGSDFTFADLTLMNVSDYEYKLASTSKVNDVAVWVIEAKPKSKSVIERTGVEKSLLMIRQDNHMKIREVQWMKTGETKYWEAKKLETISGVVVATEISMVTKKGKAVVHSTLLQVSNVKFNQSLGENLFTVNSLEKGL
jgi:hypothetical protein